MAYVVDQWKKDPSRRGRGKRWLARWEDADGRSRSKTFAKKVDAEAYADDMAADVRRGEYIDPELGKERFAELGKRWLGALDVDPNSRIKYEACWRLHVEPAFGRRTVGAIKPSEIQGLLVDLVDRFGPSTATTARLVVQGALQVAVDDGGLRRNPVSGKTVPVPKRTDGNIVPWTDEQVQAVIDGHPEALQPIPVLGASCGLREGEIFGLAANDIDFDARVVRVRRQVKKLGAAFVFALPKNDRERITPLPEWAAAILRLHMEHHRPEPYTLPWEKPTGELRTHKLLFRWPSDDKHMRSRLYSEQTWKPALVKAGIIPAPVKDARGRRKYTTTRREGTHQLRHWYASTTLAEGVSIKELAEYLGHHDPAFTLRVYAHLLPSSHDRARAAVDARMFKPRAVPDAPVAHQDR